MNQGPGDRATTNTGMKREGPSLLLATLARLQKTKAEPSNKIKSMLYSNFQTGSILYETETEPKAVMLYLKEAEQEGLKLEAKDVALLVSKKQPYLGENFDRIIFNPATAEKWALEVKAPLRKAGMTVEEACRANNFYLEKKADGNVGLKTNHDYFYQVQGQLSVSGMTS